MKNHTPTPWAEPVTYGSSKFELMSAEFHATPIAVVNTLADAHRIRACVNACEGMKHPAAEIAALRKQRDKLLAELKTHIEPDCGCTACAAGVDLITEAEAQP